MTSPPPLPPNSDGPGQEAARLVADVLRDQAERAGQRTLGSPAHATRAVRWLVCGALAAASVWMWLAPPAVVAPPPLEPSTEMLETGLRMELYVTAMAVERFRESHGRFPGALDELDEEVEPWVEYRLHGRKAYELSGRLGDRAMLWTSTQPLAALHGRRPGPLP